MELSAFCTASSYNIRELLRRLKKKFTANLVQGVIHIADNDKDVFYFPYGAVICWGATLSESQRYLRDLEDCQSEPLAKAETDNYTFSFGKQPHMEEDKIFLPNKETLTKLAASHGFAQSVKLGAFEERISQVFDQTRQIPLFLAKKGKIPLSRKEIRKKMGELFINRSSINLHVDVLDTPEFFWEHPELEPIYMTVRNELEIETRGFTLNQRLNVVRELFEMLGNELNHQHSSRLEWTIIWLILIEVLISLLTYYHIV